MSQPNDKNASQDGAQETVEHFDVRVSKTPIKPGERRLNVGYTRVEFQCGPQNSRGAIFVTPAATADDCPMLTIEFEGVRTDINFLDIVGAIADKTEPHEIADLVPKAIEAARAKAVEDFHKRFVELSHAQAEAIQRLFADLGRSEPQQPASPERAKT
jgi:hypothetical protein